MGDVAMTETGGRLLGGRYRLTGVLGRGGMGTVWRAEDEMLGRTVAVKELRMHDGVDEQDRHRLVVRTLREAKATARIRHTAAVTVFDVVEEDDRPWIVMELVGGRSLAEVIKEDGPLSPVRAAEIALEVLGVLCEAHELGILHRDVKPSNVLIGDDGRVVLTDFGIASVEGDTSVTSTGMLVGAPSYISPERARGQKPGPPADLWSLGGTLYAMVEGKPPYDRGSALATLTAVMTEPLTPPVSAGRLLTPLIEGLLEKDPALRVDAAAARPLLRRVVAEGTARAESTTEVAAIPVAGPARRWPLVAAAVLVVVALVAGVVLWQPWKDKDRGSAAGPVASAPAAASTPAGSASAGSSPATTPTPTPATTPNPTPGQLTGYREVRGAQGYTIKVPDWLKEDGVSDDGSQFYYRGNGITLSVAWTAKPGPSALKVWEEMDAGRDFRGYKSLGTKALTFRSWTNAADWEWTYDGRTGIRQHSLDRGFVTGKYGYAIYWTVPDADWSKPEVVQARQVSFDSFQPAP
ncbi:MULTISPECIES: serine/threonine-protein kinase [unclassified Kitasatospora]|uniref:serine/threonine-protein kinase n=1 Tax=unclassified Kitasatospora TaxID=2633591 RepID=UPI0012FB27E3